MSNVVSLKLGSSRMSDKEYGLVGDAVKRGKTVKIKVVGMNATAQSIAVGTEYVLNRKTSGVTFTGQSEDTYHSGKGGKSELAKWAFDTAEDGGKVIIYVDSKVDKGIIIVQEYE